MRTFPIHQITPILGKEAGLFAHHLDRILREVDGTKYDFEDAKVFAGRKPLEMNRVYWTEILYRSHWIAAGTLIRTQRWLLGFVDAHRQSNLLSAAACARGLIESAADAEYTLGVVPPTLARNNQRTHNAIEGNLLSSFVSPELENRLIHFTHGRRPKRGESLPKAHVARQVGEYRKRLDAVTPEVTATLVHFRRRWRVAEFGKAGPPWLAQAGPPAREGILSVALHRLPSSLPILPGSPMPRRNRWVRGGHRAQRQRHPPILTWR